MGHPRLLQHSHPWSGSWEITTTMVGGGRSRHVTRLSIRDAPYSIRNAAKELRDEPLTSCMPSRDASARPAVTAMWDRERPWKVGSSAHGRSTGRVPDP